MTADELELWNKIAAFKLDDEQSSFKFSKRLALENGWTKTYTDRVITEYRKFIFMCCISETGVTPSDPVDQAWHLHLTYTQSYWVDLCRNTINREIHHNPTKGGGAEDKKFDSFYTSSRRLYLDKFGAEPPADIWHHNTERFTDIHFQRVNLGRYWLIKKPKLKISGVLQINALLLGLLLWEIHNADDLSILWFLVVAVIFVVMIYKKESEKKAGQDNEGGDSSGCNGGADTVGSHHSHGHHSDSGHHGCSGGHHGCSSHSCSSGCSSGCGSGCSSGCGSSD